MLMKATIPTEGTDSTQTNKMAPYFSKNVAFEIKNSPVAPVVRNPTSSELPKSEHIGGKRVAVRVPYL